MLFLRSHVECTFLLKSLLICHNYQMLTPLEQLFSFDIPDGVIWLAFEQLYISSVFSSSIPL